jgi:hypothetical protein
MICRGLSLISCIGGSKKTRSKLILFISDLWHVFESPSEAYMDISFKY